MYHGIQGWDEWEAKGNALIIPCFLPFWRPEVPSSMSIMHTQVISSKLQNAGQNPLVIDTYHVHCSLSRFDCGIPAPGPGKSVTSIAFSPVTTDLQNGG